MTSTSLNYYELVNLTQDEIRARMKADRSFRDAVPVNGPEYAQFARFVGMEPGSDERKKIAADLSGAPAEQGENEPEERPEEGASADNPPAPEPSDEPANAGYESPEALAAALKEQREINERLSESYGKTRRQLDTLNAERGQLGDKVKALEEKINSLTAKPDPEKNGKEQKASVLPKLPDPNDYEDGSIDPKYEKDTREYQQKVYEMSQMAYSKISELQKKIDDVEGKVRPAYDYVNQAQKSSQQAALENGWSGLWADVSDFQRSHGLTTSVPIETIDTYLTQSNSGDEAARASFENLPDRDKQVYKNIVKVVQRAYDTSGIPKRRLGLRAAAVDAGLENELGLFRPTQGQRDQVANNLLHQPDSNVVDAPPASGHMENPRNIPEGNDPQNDAERFEYLFTKVYRPLVDKHARGNREPLTTWEQSNQADEMRRLADKLGVKMKL